MRIIICNIGVAPARGRQLRTMLSKKRRDILIIIETKTASVEPLMTAWPGAGVEFVQVTRPDVASAPRSGVEGSIFLDMKYSVAYVNKKLKP